MTLDLVTYDEVDSTNDELRRLLYAETPSAGVVKAVLAERQTKGKGRLGRSWQSPRGGAYFSLALDTTEAKQHESALSLIVALAVRETLERSFEGDEAGQHPRTVKSARTSGTVTNALSGTRQSKRITSSLVQVKWPNDLVCEQGKLAGILVESLHVTPHLKTAIVGVGINVVRTETIADKHSAYLSDLQGAAAPKSVEKLALAALQGILTYYQHWQQAAYGFTDFKDEYNMHLSLLHKQVTATNVAADKSTTGRVEGVDDQGFLALVGQDGTHLRVAGGEVTLR